MGCFHFTCALSGLPIGPGDKVRFLLLQQSPYGEGWYLRAPPIRAEYNDYGSVEHMDPVDDPIAKLWLSGLDVDLIEKGWGENQCHDVPTRKGMTFDAMLEALGEERLRVRATLETTEQRRAKDKRMRKFWKRKPTGKGIPTLKRIEKAIASAGTVTYTVDDSGVIRGPGGKYQYTPPKEEKNYSPTYDPHKGFNCGTRVNCGYSFGPIVDGKSPEEGETLGQFRARCGLPGAGTHAAETTLWRGGRWARVGDEDTHVPTLETWVFDNNILGNEDHKFIVDVLRYGEVRVRVGGYGSGPEHKMRLHGLAKKLGRKYAVMVSPGDSGQPQLIIHPKPGTLDQDHYFAFRTNPLDKVPKHCALAQTMVREDVWQGILAGMTADFWDAGYKTITGTLDVFRELARKSWDDFRKMWASHLESAEKAREKYKDDPERLELFTEFNDYEWESKASGSNPVGWLVAKNPSINGFGMPTSFMMFAKRTDLTEEEITNFLDVIAQTALVDMVIRTIRLVWRPVGSQGPQCGEWKEHLKFHQMLASLAQKEVDEEEARRREWAERVKATKDAPPASPEDTASA